jgi:hypothetical protein
VTVEADVLLHGEVHDPEEWDEDQYRHSHGDGCPDEKLCHEVTSRPGVLPGGGPEVAGQMLINTGDNLDRIKSEAAFGSASRSSSAGSTMIAPKRFLT